MTNIAGGCKQHDRSTTIYSLQKGKSRWLNLLLNVMVSAIVSNERRTRFSNTIDRVPCDRPAGF
jgi:hypothetical protein